MGRAAGSGDGRWRFALEHKHRSVPLFPAMFRTSELSAFRPFVLCFDARFKGSTICVVSHPAVHFSMLGWTPVRSVHPQLPR